MYMDSRLSSSDLFLLLLNSYFAHFPQFHPQRYSMYDLTGFKEIICSSS